MLKIFTFGELSSSMNPLNLITGLLIIAASIYLFVTAPMQDTREQISMAVMIIIGLMVCFDKDPWIRIN